MQATSAASTGAWSDRVLVAPRRFPVATALSVSVAAVLMLQTALDWQEEPAITIVIGLVIGFGAAVATVLFGERRNWPASRRHMASALAAAAAVNLALVPNLPDGATNGIGLFYLFSAVLLLLIVSTWRSDDRQLWEFNLALWMAVGFSAVLVGLVAAALGVFIGGYNELIGTFEGDPVAYLFIVLLTLIWPWLALTLLPATGTATGTATEPPAWTRIVARILVVISIVYLAVVYLYLIVTTIRWELPDGGTGLLVAGFAGTAITVWHLTWGFRTERAWGMGRYHEVLPKLLLAPGVVLTLAAFLRIRDHGFTEARYGLALVGGWLIAYGLYGLVVASPRLMAGPLSLGLLLLLASFGPWGVEAVPTASQLQRLESALTEAGVMADGRYLGRATASTEADVASIVDFLERPARAGEFDAWLNEQGFPGDTNLVASWGLPGTASATRTLLSSETVMATDGYTHVTAFDLDGDTAGWTADRDYTLRTDEDRLVIGAGGEELIFDLGPLLAEETDRFDLAVTGRSFDAAVQITRIKYTITRGEPYIYEIQGLIATRPR